MSRTDGIDLDHQRRARLLQELIRLGDLYNQAEPTTTQMSCINKSALRPSLNAFTRTTEQQLPDCRRVAGNVRCKASSTTESRHALPTNHPHHRDTDAHTLCEASPPDWAAAKEEPTMRQNGERKQQTHRTGGGALNPLARVDLTGANCEASAKEELRSQEPKRR